MSPGTGSSSRISLVARVQSLSMLGLYQLAEFLPYCGGPSRAEEATRTGIILKEQSLVYALLPITSIVFYCLLVFPKSCCFTRPRKY